MATSRGRVESAGLLLVGLFALTVVSAFFMLQRLDPRSGALGNLGTRVFPLAIMVLAVRRYRPAHPWFWWLLAVYYASTTVTSLRSLLLGWNGSPGSRLDGSLLRFGAMFVGGVAVISAALLLLLVRRRTTARWALPDAVVMGLGLFTALLVAGILPVAQDFGSARGFWTDVVLTGVRNLVLVVVAVVLLYSEQIRSLPVRVMTGMFIVWGVTEPLLVRAVAAGVTGGVRTVLSGLLVGCTLAVCAVAIRPSMREVIEPSGSPRATWNTGRTIAFVACLLVPVIAVCLQPPRSTPEVVIVLGAFVVLMIAVVLRMRGSVLQAHRLLDQVEQLADHDPLTDLPNRRYLYGAFLTELEGHQISAGSTTVVVSYLDLDNLREVNDRLEHSGGDRLLQAVAGRVRRFAGPHRATIRVGGDEFVVLSLLAADKDAALAAAESQALVLAALEELAQEGFDSSGSVGTSWGRTGPAPSTATERLLDRLLLEADLAQAEAKRAGGARGVVFDPTMGTRSRTRALLRRSLPGAWAGGEMALAYQSVMDLHSGEVFGAESLLRWTHPELGPVDPPHAIDAAVGLGLINELGLQILSSALEAVAAPGVPAGVRVGVNVTAPQLRPGAIDALLTMVERDGLADRVWLEVTEQLLVQERRHIRGALSDLRAAGLMVAIDDFGTGYCGLDYLCTLPIDLIKLDKVFAAHIDDPVRRQVCRTVAHLAEAIGAEVVAEGLESWATAERMAELGCRYGQGFALSLPIPSFEEAVRRSSRVRVPPHLPVPRTAT